MRVAIFINLVSVSQYFFRRSTKLLSRQGSSLAISFLALSLSRTRSLWAPASDRSPQRQPTPQLHPTTLHCLQHWAQDKNRWSTLHSRFFFLLLIASSLMQMLRLYSLKISSPLFDFLNILSVLLFFFRTIYINLQIR
jgi:hypothetical protein